MCSIAHSASSTLTNQALDSFVQALSTSNYSYSQEQQYHPHIIPHVFVCSYPIRSRSFSLHRPNSSSHVPFCIPFYPPRRHVLCPILVASISSPAGQVRVLPMLRPQMASPETHGRPRAAVTSQRAFKTQFPTYGENRYNVFQPFPSNQICLVSLIFQEVA